MYEDIIRLVLISISEEWTSGELKQYALFHTDVALAHLQELAYGIDFGDSLWKWAIYLAIMKFDLTGFEVIIGRKTGSNIAWLERRVDWHKD
jgi:hypothetical protein